jgi:hypothetical protein
MQARAGFFLLAAAFVAPVIASPASTLLKASWHGSMLGNTVGAFIAFIAHTPPVSSRMSKAMQRNKGFAHCKLHLNQASRLDEFPGQP